MIRREIDLLDEKLIIGRKYKIKRLNADGRTRESCLEIEAILEEKYKHYHLFRNHKGIRECFLKKDFIIGECEIKEG